MELVLPYGHTQQRAEVEDGRVIAQLRTPACKGIEDTAQAFEQALANPAGPPLEEVVKRGDRVLVMTVDHTRPNPSDLLFRLLERIESLGGKPEIMIGLGNHRPMTDEELDRFLGTHQVHQNASRDPEQWRLGTTTNGTPIEVSPVLRDFDKRIVMGFIEPHYIAGFSGGRKMILPACSSYASTTHNHFLTLPHGPQLGRLRGNPVHEDMLQAARAVGVHWILDAVVNPDDSLCSLHAGELETAHYEGVQVARHLYSHTVPQRADIVICSSGGYPYDVDMVQAKKTLAPALECVKPGGVVILLGECERGWGASEPEWALLRSETVLQKREEITRSMAQSQLHDAWPPCSPGVLFSRVVHDAGASLIVVSRLNSQLKDTYLQPADDLASALTLAEERVGKQSTILALHEGRRTICAVLS
jgi:nickel-dependent lactate racemase